MRAGACATALLQRDAIPTDAQVLAPVMDAALDTLNDRLVLQKRPPVSSIEFRASGVVETKLRHMCGNKGVRDILAKQFDENFREQVLLIAKSSVASADATSVPARQ